MTQTSKLRCSGRNLCATQHHAQKIHDLRSASPLGAFRGERKAAGTGVCVAEGEEEGEKKSFLPRSQLAVSYLVPRTRCLSRRQPCRHRQQPRVLQPEPRGNLPAAPTGWAGQEEAVGAPGCCNPPAWVTSTEPDHLTPLTEPWGCYSKWLEVV